MGLIVQKFGGTSVGTPERIRGVADRVVGVRGQGHDLVVVVSAMGDATDDLVRLARGVTGRSDVARRHPREMDMLLTAGERTSMALLAMAIRERGAEAVSFTGSQAAIITDESHTAARITEVRADRVRAEMSAGRIVIVAGFQGVSRGREVTTLGRGGSDTSAVALAVALEADRCEVFTDVPGVYSADPRHVPTARIIREISYSEMIELATSGAGVMHPRAIEIAARYGVEVRVASSFDASPEAPCTRITAQPAPMEDLVLTGVASRPGQARLVVHGLPGGMETRARMLRCLAEAGVSVDMIGEADDPDGRIQLQCSVEEDDLEAAREELETFRSDVPEMRIESHPSLTRIGLVGSGMHARPGVYARIFEVLTDADVDVIAITSSAISIGMLVPSERASAALDALHGAFVLQPATAAAESGGRS